MLSESGALGRVKASCGLRLGHTSFSVGAPGRLRGQTVVPYSVINFV